MAQRPLDASEIAGRRAWVTPLLGGLRSDLAQRWVALGGRLASFEGVQRGQRVDIWVGTEGCELSKRLRAAGLPVVAADALPITLTAAPEPPSRSPPVSPSRKSNKRRSSTESASPPSVGPTQSVKAPIAMHDKPASAPTANFEPSAPPRKRRRRSIESAVSSQPSTTESASTAPTSIFSPAPPLQIETRSRAKLHGRTLFPIDCVKIESDEDEDKPAIVPRTMTPLECLFDADGRLSIDVLFANLPTIGLPVCATPAERTTKLRSQIFVPPTPRAFKPKAEPID